MSRKLDDYGAHLVSNTRSLSWTWRNPWVLAGCIVYALFWFAALTHRPLYHPDEGRYAEIPREMLATGDWIVPRLNGFIYIEKPPLQYWMTALAYKAFGQHQWTARLWTGLTGFATLLMVAAFVTRQSGVQRGIFTAALSGSTLFWLLMGHQLTLDTSLTFFTTAALLAFCASQRASEHLKRLCTTTMWLALGCAVLTKGFVALMLPAAAFVIYTIWQRDWQRWRSLHLGAGALIVFATVTPWMFAIQHRVPQFFDFFVIREHLLRYLTPIAQRAEPWWYFAPVLLAGLLPWTVLYVSSLLNAWRVPESLGQFSQRRLLWTSAVTLLVFFSASHSKLSPYILPMFPILWILGSESPESHWPHALRSGLASSVLLAAASAAAALWLTLHSSSEQTQFLTGVRGILIAVAAAIAVGAFAAALLRRAGFNALAVIALALAWTCAAGVFVYGRAEVDTSFSGRSLALALNEHGAQHLPVFSVDTYDQTIPFYLKRTVQLVSYQGELEFGIALAPSDFIADIETFARRWSASAEGLAVMEPTVFDDLTREHVPMSVIARDPHHVAVSRAQR